MMDEYDSEKSRGDADASPKGPQRHVTVYHHANTVCFGKEWKRRRSLQSILPSSNTAAADSKTNKGASEVGAVLEARASLKRHAQRHGRASMYYRRRFHLLAGASLMTTAAAPIIQVLEVSLGSSFSIQMMKSALAAMAILFVGIQNMMGFQAKADQHTRAANEFDDLKLLFDYHVWYPSLHLPQDAESGGSAQLSTKLTDFFNENQGKIMEVASKTPALHEEFEDTTPSHWFGCTRRKVEEVEPALG